MQLLALIDCTKELQLHTVCTAAAQLAYLAEIWRMLRRPRPQTYGSPGT